MPKDIPLQEDFASPSGGFTSYDADDTSQRGQAFKQRHVDIRNFHNEDTTVPLQMIHLDRNQLFDIDLVSMTDLEGTVVIQQGEEWSEGSVGRMNTKNNWHGLTMTCTPGVNSTFSFI
jgi:hypothetical protein